jgi:Tfp pilus assembly pilus retraction ATPase PilT
MLKNRPILAIRMLLVQPIISAINWGFCEIARHIHEVIKTTNGKQFERDREADFSVFSSASFRRFRVEEFLASVSSRRHSRL